MPKEQLSFPFLQTEAVAPVEDDNKTEDSILDFHAQDVTYASHNFHPFPAKFPPQLPKHFIELYTKPGDIVLDPMSGSGTTILEATLTERRAIGTDIDPLAILIAMVKTTPINPLLALDRSKESLNRARIAVDENPISLIDKFKTGRDKSTNEFIDFWFDRETQLELIGLIAAIERIEELQIKNFLKLAFSAIIIKKSGGVSLALDLAHTRPHRAKLIYKQNGEILEGAEYLTQPVKNLSYATKRLRSPFLEFERKVEANLGGILPQGNHPKARVTFGNAENLPIASDTIDLIVTSPPYASNAIDYMRAHKFSLVWFGYPVTHLSKKRGTYIGGEITKDVIFEELPQFTSRIVGEISQLNNKKGQVLARYYSEMRRVLREMYRVLKPGKKAVLVVGNSIMEGCSTRTHLCLADIGKQIGFSSPNIIERNLDRDRRMMPTGKKVDENSQIQQRMHKEYVLEFEK